MITEEIILADFSNFNETGGAEKNGIKIIEELEKNEHLNILKIERKYLLFKYSLLHLFRLKKVKCVFTFKNSAFSSLFFNIQGIRVFRRVNNSPEAYLYWRGFRSIVSFYLRLHTPINDILIFNSHKVRNFYLSQIKRPPATIYMPNYQDFVISFARSGKKKCFLAARYSPEKNMDNTINCLKHTTFLEDYTVEIYTDSKCDLDSVQKFHNLKINFDDIYVSMSYFEGMPNMAYEALASGSKLLLSNCWAHVELANELSRAGLGSRVLIYDFEDNEGLDPKIATFFFPSHNEDTNDIHQKTVAFFDEKKRLFECAIDQVLNKI